MPGGPTVLLCHCDTLSVRHRLAVGQSVSSSPYYLVLHSPPCFPTVMRETDCPSWHWLSSLVSHWSVYWVEHWVCSTCLQSSSVLVLQSSPSSSTHSLSVSVVHSCPPSSSQQEGTFSMSHFSLHSGSATQSWDNFLGDFLTWQSL